MVANVLCGTNLVSIIICRQGHTDDYYLKFATVECMFLGYQPNFDDNSTPLFRINRIY